jgi:hypothetical protein
LVTIEKLAQKFDAGVQLAVVNDGVLCITGREEDSDISPKLSNVTA